MVRVSGGIIYIYIINQQDATLAVLCLLKTESMLYMFWTPTHSYNEQKNLPLTLTMTLTTKIQPSHHISFKHWHLHYPPESPTWFLLFRFSKQTSYSLLVYYMHATCHIMYYVNPLAYTNACQAFWAIDVFSFNSSLLSVDGMTCLIPFQSWRNDHPMVYHT